MVITCSHVREIAKIVEEDIQFPYKVKRKTIFLVSLCTKLGTGTLQQAAAWCVDLMQVPFSCESSLGLHVSRQLTMKQPTAYSTVHARHQNVVPRMGLDEVVSYSARCYWKISPNGEMYKTNGSVEALP